MAPLPCHAARLPTDLHAVTLPLLQDHGLDAGLDVQLIPRCAPALPFGNAKPVPVYIEERALNTQRAIGTTLSHEVRAHAHFQQSQFKLKLCVYGHLPSTL